VGFESNFFDRRCSAAKSLSRRFWFGKLWRQIAANVLFKACASAHAALGYVSTMKYVVM
jgi:hypothetical protein